jgi:hypothetical protein
MCLPVHPFKVEREWKHKGLSCAVVQAREGQHRCAYVRVPPTHPLYGKDYDNLGRFDARVHGGLTFAQIEPCSEHEDGQGWWFGWDYAHCGDAMYDPAPDLAAMTPQGRELWTTLMGIHQEVHGKVADWAKYPLMAEHYWTQAEVERECERFAEQLAKVRSRTKRAPVEVTSARIA